MPCLKTRVIPVFFQIPWKGKKSSKHIEILYVDRSQFATLLLPLTSTGFYPDGNSLGKSMENSGKQNPKIKPSATIRNGYKGLLPEADYVVLASVRDTDAIVMSSGLLRNIFTLTKPGALGQFLLRAGYKDV